MKTFLASLFLFGFFITQTTLNSVADGSSVESVSFYKVPLVCGAASHIGCGSRSKPVLLALENDATIEEAWLNRTGTVIAVVWKSDLYDVNRIKVVTAIFKNNQLKFEDIKDDEHAAFLNEFKTGSNWYRSINVDRLSEEEADIIAGRLITNIKTKTNLSEDKLNEISVAFSDVFKTRFKGNINWFEITDEKRKEFQKEIEDNLIKIGARYLDEKGILDLKEGFSTMYSDKKQCCKDSKACKGSKTCCKKNKKKDCDKKKEVL